MSFCENRLMKVSYDSSTDIEVHSGDLHDRCWHDALRESRILPEDYAAVSSAS